MPKSLYNSSSPDFLSGFAGFAIGLKPYLDSLGIGRVYFLLLALTIGAGLCETWRSKSLNRSLLLFTILVSLSLTLWGTFSISPYGLFEAGLIGLHYLTALAFLKIFISYPRSARFFLVGYFLSVAFLASYALYEPVYAGGRLTLEEEFNPSWFAAYLAAGTFTGAMVLSFVKSRMAQVITLIIMAILCFSLVGTQGRNALLAMVVSVAIWGFLGALLTSIYACHSFRLDENFRNLMRHILAFILAGSFILGVVILGEKYQLIQLHRIERLWSGDLAAATAGRTEIIAMYWDVILEGKVFSGFGGSEYVLEKIHGVRIAPHNLYLLLIVETAGTLLLLWMVLVYSLLYMSIKKNSALLFVLTVYLAVFSGGNDVLYYIYFWNFIFILVAWIGVLYSLPYRRASRVLH